MAIPWIEDSEEEGEGVMRNCAVTGSSGVVHAGVVDIFPLHLPKTRCMCAEASVQAAAISLRGSLACQLVERIEINKRLERQQPSSLSKDPLSSVSLSVVKTGQKK